MIIKPKSLIVALISSFVVSLVLVLTLIGYLAYIELKGEEFKRAYQELLLKVNAKAYSRHIEITRLRAEMEEAGPLRGKPVIKGVITNNGPKNIISLLLRVRFMDKDCAAIYETAFYPDEPSLGSALGLDKVFLHAFSQERIILKPGESLAFKKILAGCPQEITTILRKGGRGGEGPSGWAGRLACEAVSIDFQSR